MGKALYRKYRSKSFDEVVGQKHITDTLKNAVAKGAISHAYLFTGPRGVGKTSIARILAHAINGLDYTDESTHLDIIEIDAASNRRIDEIRELRDKVNIAPTSCKYKVYIIDEVHMLTREAFNALLKTLEEPPAHSVFILATTELHKVPETIISRTQRFAFKPITREHTIDHLASIADKEGIIINLEALQLLADHGRGSFRDSISMLDQIAGMGKSSIDVTDVTALLGIPNTTLLTNLLSAVKRGDTNSLFQTTQQLREAGAQTAPTAQAIISLLKSQLVDGETILPAKSTVSLMKSLLPLSAANTSLESLEIIMLDAIEFTETAATATKITAAITKKTSAPRAAATAAETTLETKLDSAHDATATLQSSDEKVSVATIPPAQSHTKQHSSNSSPWDEVVREIRSHHTTLHSVLRMARVTVGDDISIVFQFGFHKKQLEQTKNMQVLQEYVKKYFGKAYQVRITVESKSPTAAPRKQKAVAVRSDSTESALKNISSIFGDAELLEP